ncbi:LysM peptidoglycan-binding domain-containing protein [Tissierella pigra]|uniref:muramidase family protein n=1 Tax=Tissierella pigra TaxID=2607614 RepID=UPI001C0FBE2F|nr:LysM peptidoglycan-binding domain-containing protein [Tissierella pigra]MBU5425249.1 LysM peptidoglycan-binding domain-containing protein [Tissierella pigra]
MCNNRACPTGSFSYTIKSGDTLYKLAMTYNTTVEAIMKLNPGINPNNLQIGQRICIPEGTTPPKQCPTGSFSYTIKSGDTLYNLAIKYNTTVEAIMKLNPGINPNNLQIGQVICIPQGTTPPRQCPTGSFPYTIKSGDTLYKLAITYNTTVEAIMAINPGINPNNLQIGQVICIPQGTTPPRQCPTGSFPYTIKSGDTLYKLAITYNTTVEAIMAINPGINPNNLQIGQVICIPQGTTPPRQCPTGSFPYTIKSGDTLYKLAITYNTTVEAIMAINPGINPNNLQIGQVICIPQGTTPPKQCPIGSFAYTIKSGDTLYNLAITYNTTVEAIMAINPGINPNNLQIGQVICIPMGSPVPPCNGVYYTVRPGDTLYSIAMMFNVSLQALMAANPGVDPNNLQVGQLICVPKTEIPCPGGVIHTVTAGETAVDIMLRYNISLTTLADANPNVDLNHLRVGQELCIMPHQEMGCPCPPKYKQYKIDQCDVPTTGSIIAALAQKFNTTVAELLIANPTMSPGDFVVGKIICVPGM